jgi:hypothetical protein
MADVATVRVRSTFERPPAPRADAWKFPWVSIVDQGVAHSRTCDRGPGITRERVKGRSGTKTCPTDFPCPVTDTQQTIWRRLFFWGRYSCRVHFIEQNVAATWLKSVAASRHFAPQPKCEGIIRCCLSITARCLSGATRAGAVVLPQSNEYPPFDAVLSVLFAEEKGHRLPTDRLATGRPRTVGEAGFLGVIAPSGPRRRLEISPGFQSWMNRIAHSRTCDRSPGTPREHVIGGQESLANV